MKPIRYASLALAMTLLAGCYGSFTLTKKVYQFNGSISSDKFVKSAATWALVIIPVYGLAGLADFAVLNTIEFWTGSNPVALGDGESETQTVMMDGNTVKLTAEANRIVAEVLSGPKAGSIAALEYVPASRSWVATDGTFAGIVAQETADGHTQLLGPDGSVIREL